MTSIKLPTTSDPVSAMYSSALLHQLSQNHVLLIQALSHIEVHEGLPEWLRTQREELRKEIAEAVMRGTELAQVLSDAQKTAQS